MIRHLFFLPVADTVDVEDRIRKRLIQEAEYQARCDAGSRVLRISGQVQITPGKPIPAVVVMERVK